MTAFFLSSGRSIISLWERERGERGRRRGERERERERGREREREIHCNSKLSKSPL